MASLPLEAVEDFTPDQVQSLYPSNLTLQYVQIFFRHGERTPVRKRLLQAGLPGNWSLCSVADEFREAALHPTGQFHTLHYHRKIEVPEQDARLRDVTKSADRYCILGELTDQGRVTTLALGQRLRRLYVDQLGFLPPKFEDDKLLYIRTSFIQRTIDSTIQVFTGLYPPGQVGAVPNFHRRLTDQENLYPNEDHCDLLKKLSTEYSVKAATQWDPKLRISGEIVEKWIPDGVRVNGRPKATGLLDTINASIANDMPLPSEMMDVQLRQDLESAAVAEWFNGYLENETYKRLGVGPVLGDVVDRFTFATKVSSPQKMALYGTHDTTIGAFLCTFGVFDSRWPPFTSNITFEMFKAAPSKGGFLRFLKTKDEYFVRMRYNQSVVALPGTLPSKFGLESGKADCEGCKEKGKHHEGDETLCTLDAFKEIVEKVRPVNWKEECRVREAEKEPKYHHGDHQ